MPDRQCVGCTHQAEWGCEAERYRQLREDDLDERDCWVNPALLPLTMDGVETFACPRQGLHREPAFWSLVLKYYGMYKQGFLPQAGAVVDQSNKAIELFRVLDEVNAECDAQRQAKEERKKGDPFDRRR